MVLGRPPGESSISDKGDLSFLVIIDWVGLIVGFQILVLVVEQNIATEWRYNWFPGLILGAFYTIFRA